MTAFRRCRCRPTCSRYLLIYCVCRLLFSVASASVVPNEKWSVKFLLLFPFISAPTQPEPSPSTSAVTDHMKWEQAYAELCVDIIQKEILGKPLKSYTLNQLSDVIDKKIGGCRTDISMKSRYRY